MAIDGVPRDLGDRWDLAWSGRVEQLQIDYRFSLLVGARALLSIGGVARLIGGPEGPASRLIDPEAVAVVDGLRLLHDEVCDAVAFKTGVLRVRLSSGRELWVAPDDRYEAWETSGPGTAKLVCMPGGELAVWI